MDNEKVLKELGVKIIRNKPIKTDIRVLGCLNGFFIYPYNYYWVVNGKMPIKYANVLYKYRDKYGIRVDGGSNDNKPIEHCTSDEFEDFCNNMSSELSFMELGEWSKKLMSKKNELKDKDLNKFYVATYHIDDVKGLKKVVDIIRNNDIVTVW